MVDPEHGWRLRTAGRSGDPGRPGDDGPSRASRVRQHSTERTCPERPSPRAADSTPTGSTRSISARVDASCRFANLFNRRSWSGNGRAVDVGSRADVAREYPTVLDLVGNTPIVRLDRIGRDVAPTARQARVPEPGRHREGPHRHLHDRGGRARRAARPGGTIVEPTSGNTGVGLAIAAAQKGYRCIFVMPDKMSQEKISMLRAYGAEVIITPTAVEPDSPESYYSVSARSPRRSPAVQARPVREHVEPGGALPHDRARRSWSRPAASSTRSSSRSARAARSPASAATSRSTAGGADRRRRPRGLGLHGRRGAPDVGPYLVEGIGKDTWPETMDPAVVDEWIRVSDRDSFVTARRLAREEGLLVGGSGGSTVWAALEVASRFGPRAHPQRAPRQRPLLPLEVLRRQLDAPVRLPRAGSAAADRRRGAALQARRGTTTRPTSSPIATHQKVGAAIDLMQRYSISQLPVVREEPVESLADVVGSLNERDLLDRVFKNADALQEDVAVAMSPPLAAVDVGDSLDQVYADAHRPQIGRGGRARRAGRRRSSRAPTCSSTSRTARQRGRGDVLTASPGLAHRGEVERARVGRSTAPCR